MIWTNDDGAILTAELPGVKADDLDGVADRLEAEGHAALDYNYGLWYDRRRDDHQRTRA